MPHAKTADGVALYYEVQGRGAPVLFVHELAGSCRSFDLQVAAWKGQFACAAYNARGYPPSDVPPAVDSYSQENAARDIGAVLDGLGWADAHIMGVSMGSAATLQFALANPDRARSIILCSIGSGSDMKPGEFASNMEGMAGLVEKDGLRGIIEGWGASPTRLRLKDKNPAEYANFNKAAAAFSPLGLTNTMRGVQQRRPPIYAHKERIAALKVPALVVLGEEDEPCVGPSRFLKDTLPGAQLEVIAKTGHAVNLEEPAIVNRVVANFIAEIEARRSR
jgi:pimeloyl-ACP methyl ester carboxylesterase